VKSLAVILLAFEFAVYLAAKFVPIPFLGLAIGIMAFPLALRISWRHLFIVELVGMVFSYLISPENMLMGFWAGYSTLVGTDWLAFYTIVFCVFVPLSIILSSALAASLMKVLSRFTPKRIRFVVEGNP
jgi:hypothetical protein